MLSIQFRPNPAACWTGRRWQKENPNEDAMDDVGGILSFLPFVPGQMEQIEKPQAEYDVDRIILFIIEADILLKSRKNFQIEYQDEGRNRK